MAKAGKKRDENDNDKVQSSDDTNQGKKLLTGNCSTCFRAFDINECYAQCTYCKGFKLCLECLGYGFEKGTHHREHSVVLIEPKQQYFFDEEWCFEEELNLLHSIELCGIGNWEDIALRMRNIKTKEQCESHYFEIYLESENAPIPDLKIKKVKELPHQVYPMQKSCPSLGEQSNLSLVHKKECTNGAEYCGFMPNRGEFECEFNNDAEIVLNGITFDENDTESSFEDKIGRIKNYVSQLEERKIRRKTVIDWDIHMKPISKLNETTKNINPIILSFAQYIDKEIIMEYNKLINNLDSYYDFIVKHKEWESNGITTNEEGNLKDALTKIIEKERRNDKEFIENWNDAIKSYNYTLKFKTNSQNTKSILSNFEIDFCNNYNIEYSLYLGLKDFIIREFTIRNGNLSVKEAKELEPELQDYIELMYNSFKSWHII